MKRCVATARQAGVFKEFHVLTDAAIGDCESYDALDVAVPYGFHKLIYLRAAISKLAFDYFVWVDPSSVFVSNPSDLLGALRGSPIHVPLEVVAARVDSAKTLCGVSVGCYAATMVKCGVSNPILLNRSAFWIVAHDAIDTVCDLGSQGRQKAQALGVLVDVSFALGYAMQMLCGDASRHTVAVRPDLWAADYEGRFASSPPPDTAWEFSDFTGTHRIEVKPAIIRLGAPE